MTMLRDKDNPSDAEISMIRSSFRTDRETDRIMTRKLLNRRGPGYVPIALSELVAAIRRMLDAEGLSTYEMTDARWLSGGASKLQVAFALSGAGSLDGLHCVLRMEPAASIVETSRQLEFEVLRFVEGLVPAPKPLWLDAEPVHLPYPGLIYTFERGVTKPSGKSANVSGIGVNFGPERRPILAEQFVSQLGRIHLADWASAGISAIDMPPSPREAVLWQLAKWERVWAEDSNLEIPLLRYTTRWLRENLPEPDRLSLLHGDYRSGNFLFDEADNRITAWLDWELAHIGDRHEDLAMNSMRGLGHMAEDGKTFLYSGLLPEDEFYKRYEKSTGLPVIPETLQYYKIYNAYRTAINLIGTGYRAAIAGRTHQDIVLAWIMGLGYLVLGDLQTCLEEA